MKRQNLVPIIGILSLLLCIGISIYKEKQADLSQTSALPVILSDTQKMSIDEIHARFLRLFSDEITGQCAFDVDKDAHTFTMTRYDPYFCKASVNAALSDRKYLDKWNDALSGLSSLCADMQDQVSNHGHPEYSVVIRCVNCDDFWQLFAEINRGVVTYDIVAEMPPGERLS